MKPTPIQKELGSVAEVTSGQSAPQDKTAFSDTGRPFIRAGSLESLLNGQPEDSLEHIPDDKAKQFRMRLFPPDTIVFAKSGMSAKIGRVYRLKTPCYVVSHLAAILPKENLDPGYLQRWLEKNPPSRLIPNDAYPSIRLSAISSLKIPLPPLDEQRRIADILDKADEVRSKRQEAIRLTEELLRSAFLDMFGDPVTNPKGWDIAPLSQLSDVRDGTHDSPKYVQIGYPLVTSKNLRNGNIDLSEVNYISKEDYEQINQRSKVDKGDIIMPMIGTVGNPVLVEDDPNFAIKNVALIKFTQSSVSNLYILYLLRSHYFSYLIRRINRGGTQKFIALGDIRAFPIPVPNKAAQDKFSAFVLKRNNYLKTMEKLERGADSLFNSLVQRAFKGEL